MDVWGLSVPLVCPNGCWIEADQLFTELGKTKEELQNAEKTIMVLTMLTDALRTRALEGEKLSQVLLLENQQLNRNRPRIPRLYPQMTLRVGQRWCAECHKMAETSHKNAPTALIYVPCNWKQVWAVDSPEEGDPKLFYDCRVAQCTTKKSTCLSFYAHKI